MHVTVNIYSYLRRYLKDAEELMSEKSWELSQNATVGQIVEKLKLPKEIRVTVLVNNNSVDQKATLKEGDIIHILPQMFGG
jgi:molybdopterin converting factor small subunit